MPPVDVKQSLREIGRAVLRGSSYAERASRAQIAAEPLEAFARLGSLLDPYSTARAESTMMRDVLLTAERQGGPGRNDDADPAALARLAEHRDAVIIQRAIQNITTGDVPGLMGTISVGIAGPTPGAPWLDLVGDTSAQLRGNKFQGASWDPMPAVAVDPAEKSDVTSTPIGTLLIEASWHVAATALDVSAQEFDWAVGNFGADLQAMLTGAVSAGLEGILLTDLTALATASATISAARTDAATAWGLGPADLIVCSLDDQAAIEDEFSTRNQWPPPLRIIPTGSQAPGTALVMPAAAVYVPAPDAIYTAVDKPSILGRELSVRRDGAVMPRCVAAIRKVVIVP